MSSRKLKVVGFKKGFLDCDVDSDYKGFFGDMDAMYFKSKSNDWWAAFHSEPDESKWSAMLSQVHSRHALLIFTGKHLQKTKTPLFNFCFLNVDFPVLKMCSLSFARHLPLVLHLSLSVSGELTVHKCALHFSSFCVKVFQYVIQLRSLKRCQKRHCSITFLIRVFF